MTASRGIRRAPTLHRTGRWSAVAALVTTILSVSAACAPPTVGGPTTTTIFTPIRVVTTLAGSFNVPGHDDGTGAAASFMGPSGVAVDGTGTLYVADLGNEMIRKLTPAGVVTTLAGSGNYAFVDGTGPGASFESPVAVAVDAAGTLYVSDAGSNAIREVTPAGVVTTLAGAGPSFNGSLDGTGGAAQFNGPDGLVVDGLGELYVADRGNNTIRKVTSAGVVTTIAGTPGVAGHADGTGAAATFSGPAGLALDTAGNLYVTDSFNNTIRKVTPAGVVTTVAGVAGTHGNADGPAATASFWQPRGVAVDGSGNLFVTNINTNTIREITQSGLVTTIAGSPTDPLGSTDGIGSVARFANPDGIAIDAAGTLYVADNGAETIRKIT